MAQALDEVKKQVDLEAVANERFGIPGEPVETKLLRFLRARDFDVKKTMEMLNNTLVGACGPRAARAGRWHD